MPAEAGAWEPGTKTWDNSHLLPGRDEPLAAAARELQAAVDALGRERVGEAMASGGQAAVPDPPADLTFARALVDWHGQDLRYVGPWRKWLEWTGTHWRIDDTGEAMRRAKETAEAMLARMRAQGRIPPGREDVTAKWVVRLRNARQLKDALELASTEEEVVVRPDDLDTDPMLLTVANGTLDLRTGQLREPRQEDLITRASGVEWDPDAEAPEWDDFLRRVLPDEEVRSFVRRLAGYSLTGSVLEQAVPYLYGTGANGKSVFVGVLRELLGELAVEGAPDLLVVTRGQAHPTEVADLFGRRVVTLTETERGAKLNEVRLKALTGGDRVKARRMREDFWEFEPTHKFWISGNHRLVVQGGDHAIWRRLLLVPFTVTIPDEEQDKDLRQRLVAREMPGILRWAVGGCLEWQRAGLAPPEAVTSATSEWREESDPVQRFVAEMCEEGEGLVIATSDLYEAWLEWAGANRETYLDAKVFGRRVGDLGRFEPRKGTGGRREWAGLRVRHETWREAIEAAVGSG